MPKDKTRTPTSRDNARLAIWLALLVVVAVAPYVPSLWGQFTLDDWPLIVSDPFVHSLANVPHAFGRDFLHGHLGDTVPYYYRPLITISFMINYAISGPNPLPFRVTNLLLNTIAVLLVFVIGRRLTKSTVIAGVAGLAYAVLPSHAEAVAWISGRTDVMATVFLLGSFAAFCAAYESIGKFNWLMAGLCALLFTCALFSKESGLTLPLLFALYAWVFGGKARKGDLLRWTALLLPPLVVYLVMRRHVVGTAMEQYVFFMLRQRLMGIGIAYAAYLRMLFFPQEARVVYDVFPIGIKYPLVAFAAWLLPVVLVALTIWARKRAPLISFGSMWIFLALLPVTNLLPTIGPVPQERFVYLASVGSSLIFGWLACRMVEFKPTSIRIWPAVSRVIICWLVLYCGALTAGGCRCYQSNVAWARAVGNTRFAAYNCVAGKYFMQAGYYKEADASYRKAMAQARKGDLDASDFVGYAVVKRHLGRPDQAVELLKTAKTMFGDTAAIEYHLGVSYAEAGNIRRAAASFVRATDIEPRMAFSWRNLGRARLELREFRGAVEAYERAFSTIKPNVKDRFALGQAYLGAGTRDKARHEFEYVVSVEPDSVIGKESARKLKSLAR
ncbi:MAG: tetratricopeptide repeat protein [Armatimonadetes bacterium]|nr:tetratricopeptide repeat protein [Armatimonadota bacterium]